MKNSSASLTEMSGTVAIYCKVINQDSSAAENWLAELYTLLPRLHAAVTALSTTETSSLPVADVDLDARFELYTRLHGKLGDRDGYWLEFDDTPDHIHQSGSLADDLTDIYFDLQHGLDLLENAWPLQAAHAWHSSYHLHWGQHLVDAERHLYALKVRDQLEMC